MTKVSKNTSKDGELTKNEKIQVIITLILNTVISWVIYSLGWSKKLPTKAKQVNKYGLNIILALAVVAFLGFILAFIFISLRVR